MIFGVTGNLQPGPPYFEKTTQNPYGTDRFDVGFAPRLVYVVINSSGRGNNSAYSSIDTGWGLTHNYGSNAMISSIEVSGNSVSVAGFETLNSWTIRVYG